MKKILFGLLGIISLGLINFSSAVNYTCSDSSFTISEDSYFILNKFTGRGSFEIGDINHTICYSIRFGSSGLGYGTDCNVPSSFPIILSSGDYYIYCDGYTVSSFSIVPAITSCPTCPEYEDWTQLQCESEYNLIPESSITSEYCEDVFNLIDPENCPVSGGTGDINWSSFFVNSHQIQGASNIYLRLPDFLSWDYTYIDSGSTLEIDVENQGDPDYIEGLLQVQTYHPSSEDFTQSFTGTLTLLMPYIIICLFILFIWRLVKRIFK